MRTLNIRILAVGAAVVATGTFATGAQADSPVVAAIKHEQKIINPALNVLLHLKLGSPRAARSEIPKLQALVVKLDDAATVVAHASARTAKQREGRDDWVAAIGATAKVATESKAAVEDIIHGHKSAAVAMLQDAETTETEASKLERKAIRLLGIKTGHRS